MCNISTQSGVQGAAVRYDSTLTGSQHTPSQRGTRETGQTLWEGKFLACRRKLKCSGKPTMVSMESESNKDIK